MLFEPRWARMIPRSHRPSRGRVRELERLRRERRIPHEVFVTVVLGSPGTAAAVQKHAYETIRKAQPNASERDVLLQVLAQRALPPEPFGYGMSPVELNAVMAGISSLDGLVKWICDRDRAQIQKMLQESPFFAWGIPEETVGGRVLGTLQRTADILRGARGSADESPTAHAASRPEALDGLEWVRVSLGRAVVDAIGRAGASVREPAKAGLMCDDKRAAVGHFETAAAHASGAALAELHNLIGCCRAGARAYSEFAEAVQLAESLHNRRVQAAVLANMGMRLFDNLSPEVLDAYGDRGLAAALDMTPEALRAGVGQEEGLRLMRRALAINTETGYARGVAADLRSLGAMHGRIGSTETAEGYLTWALDAFRNLDDAIGEAMTHVSIGRLRMLQRSEERGVHHLVTALAVLEREGVGWFEIVLLRSELAGSLGRIGRERFLFACKGAGIDSSAAATLVRWLEQFEEETSRL